MGGVLADRIGRRATLLLATSGAGTLMLTLGFVRAGGAGTLVVIAPLLGLSTDLARPPLQAAVTDVVAPDQRVRAFAMLYWAINLGFAGAAVLGGSLAERSFTPLFLIGSRGLSVGRRIVAGGRSGSAGVGVRLRVGRVGRRAAVAGR
jgi:predicted MFS family arabinose efflux permease